MRLRAALLPELAGNTSGSVCIVIDVLRATSVVAVLFSRGCPVVYVAASHEVARSFAQSNGLMLCGETGGRKAEGFDYGNSPVEFSTLDFTGRPVILSTTNGTRAVAHVCDSPLVLLGSALNRMSVARAAWEQALDSGLDITLVCSGTDAEFTLEDAAVAGLYVEAIAGFAGPWQVPEQDDAAIACRRLWEREPNLLRGLMEGAHARRLCELDFGGDVGYCAGIDTLTVTPVLVQRRNMGAVSSPVVLAPCQDSGPDN